MVEGAYRGTRGSGTMALVFRPDDRAALRARLLSEGAAGERGVTAGALIGSSARGAEDRWSDIDLAFKVAGGKEVGTVADEWTDLLRSEANVIDTLDIWAEAALYRVHLLDSTLQIDLSFWPQGSFRSNGEPFVVAFGQADEPAAPELVTSRSNAEAIGMAWLYALHVRSALQRGRLWQAGYMLNGMRDLVMSLACIRLGLPSHQGRGVDQLPAPLLAALETTIFPAPTAVALTEAFERLTSVYLDEAARVDPERIDRLRPTLGRLTAEADG